MTTSHRALQRPLDEIDLLRGEPPTPLHDERAEPPMALGA
jgi:hypothetical protein